MNGGVPGVKVSVHQQGDFLRNEEFLLPDATLPQMAMLNTARKARIQSYLNADPALGKAANESQRYSDSTRDQSQVSDPLMHGLILAVARDRFPDLGQPDMFSEFCDRYLLLPCFEAPCGGVGRLNFYFMFFTVVLWRS